jgi:hypothetical protein
VVAGGGVHVTITKLCNNSSSYKQLLIFLTRDSPKGPSCYMSLVGKKLH